MRLCINLIDTSAGNICCPIMQSFFLSALSFFLFQSESLETWNVIPGRRKEGGMDLNEGEFLACQFAPWHYLKRGPHSEEPN